MWEGAAAPRRIPACLASYKCGAGFAEGSEAGTAEPCWAPCCCCWPWHGRHPRKAAGPRLSKSCWKFLAWRTPRPPRPTSNSRRSSWWICSTRWPTPTASPKTPTSWRGTRVAKNEKILTAELHLFRLWPRAAEGPRRHHFCQVSVYQILDKAEPDSPKGQKLLASRLLSLQGSGWEVFAITQAVRDWTQDESSNRGLLVTVHSLGGSTLEAPAVQFASSGDHHESKKPMLVLFTDDGRRGASLPMAGVPASQPRDFPAKLTGPRSARSLDRLQPCQRHPLSVDFEEIGWSGWIISPRGYNAYHCRGSCPFPLGENMRPTNHATVQSIINALKLSEGVSSPCCVPDKLYSINLLYFDDDENVVLKQYDDMVAGSCGCH
ncbi:bone morphogenetic protein 2-like isoform X3 [Centrocercus urophasianus]|uniref:bone morphogenetic protein 2-like isoform X3 n=1 Tax=Centrocercus urophasianus TaxID=9002 RepID=UPI001C65218A|nr:bone morphogenetic protein 2-like isoform X3 [Centrocercus urophasianus]XP_042685300.1 bone morphogenetic protein 2-like isoform X3 [Centrocercus urophasianus]